MNEGDWICSDPNCGNINFARRVSCYRCNKERPDGGKAFKKKLGTEIGKSAAEKSRGLFNADDWQCNKCANVNWARRQTCNVCNAPKFGEVEARTGYGGGYNERGVVEYRRREPSSEDEYDEFGRKKRKRRDEQDKVGITEGPVNKKLPPTKLQKELKLDYVKPLPPSQMPQVTRKDCDKTKASLSDGSVCDVPVNKIPFRKYQQNQSNSHMQECKLPFYKTNNVPRKRFSSIGDKEHNASFGYETGSKKSKYDNIPPVAKTYNTPVMENRVSSTNNDFLYKYPSQAPTEEIQITYSIEEKVKAAAFAIVYNNCKISSEKFEAFYDKRAPNFQTLFAWRQRLLTTGCLVDTHTEVHKKDNPTPSVLNKSPPHDDIQTKPKVVQKQPNPDEIPILSESECEYDRDSPVCKQPLQQSGRSLSADTLIVGVDETKPSARTSLSAAGDRESHSRSHSSSTHCRSRSSSRDSQDSNYPDSEPEVKSKVTKGRNASAPKPNTPKQSVHDSDSCSVSYNSEDEDFLSRSFAPNGKKTRRKIKRKPIVPPKENNYSPNDVQPFKGYSTLNSSAQSPLVTGNIYTSNLRNMVVKPRNCDNVVDTDGCSSEYVPTKLGATAKRNYQEFKNNVKKKGFWAKGNGASLMKPKQANQSVTYNVETYPSQTPGYMSGTQPATQNREELLKNDIEAFTTQKQYSLFNKPPQATCTTIITNKIDNLQKPNRVDAKHIEPTEKMVNITTGDTSSLYKTNSPENMTVNKYRKSAQNSFCTKTSDNLYGQTPKNINREFEKPLQNIYSSTPENTSHLISQQTTVSGNTQQRIPGFFDEPSQNAYTTAGNKSNIFDNLPTSQKSMSLFDDRGQASAYGKTMVDSSSIFNIVQANCATKNRSITDIFNLQEQNSPEMGNDLDKTTDSIQKMYESQWDEDDDALYNTDTPDLPGTKPHGSSQNSVDVANSEILINNSLNNPDCGTPDIYKQSNKISMDFIRDKCENLLGLFDDIQRNKETQNIPNKQMSHNFSFLEQNLKQNVSKKISDNISTNLISDSLDPIPLELSEEIKCMSEANDTPKTVSPSKQVQILESIVIPPNSALQSVVHRRELTAEQKKSPSTSPSKPLYPKQDSNFQPSDTEQSANNIQTEAQSVPYASPAQITNTSSVEANNSGTATQNTSQLDLSNLLAGINTNTLLMALQNLQQLNQSSSATDVKNNEQTNNENNGENVETINLTNDEDWERESYREGSIERQLARLDGNTADTPFLSDIFDPGPVVVPQNVAKKVNLNLRNPEDNKNENHTSHLNENAPVIGNFKSFALPKPILLNRLKLTVKAPERTFKKSAEDKKNKRKKKSKEGTSQEGEGGGEEDEEESGDEADLSKYDLWGSDGEQGPSSKHDDEDKDQEDREGSKGQGSESGDKNGKSPSAESKGNRRRSRSSSSSSTSSSSSSSSHSSDNAPKNKFDDFNLNSERESVHSSPKGRKSRTRSRSPRARSSIPPTRRKSRDSRSAGESRSSRDKEKSRERERRDGRERSRGAGDDRKPRRYSRDSKPYSARGRHR